MSGHVSTWLAEYGLWLLFILVAVESAGIPLPGETALILAGVGASQGQHSIWAVIAVAALAAIIGDNVGYWIGRKGGRAILPKIPFLGGHFLRALPPAELYFEKHGGKTVFFGRFVAGLRITAAWIAGITHMNWWRFLFWNALGGIVWATAFGLIAYKGGDAALDFIDKYEIWAVVILVIVFIAGFFVLRYFKKRMFKELEEPE